VSRRCLGQQSRDRMALPFHQAESIHHVLCGPVNNTWQLHVCWNAALRHDPLHVACSWASTCQTIGMNIGYFTSFTAFLALNDAGFCNKYLRRASARAATGILSLTAYLRFWGWVYLIVTVGIALFKREVNFPTQKGERRI